MEELKLNFTDSVAVDTLAQILNPVICTQKRGWGFLSFYTVIAEFGQFSAQSLKRAMDKYKQNIYQRIRSEAQLFLNVAVAGKNQLSCSEQLELFRCLPYSEEQLNAIISILISSDILEVKRIRINGKQVKAYTYTQKYSHLNKQENAS